ncbi:hypothetical protein M23134_06513 [Microscilla marina ATCC 23134]|uniref:Uncharacterized protein n=1 Tax=Microscilla marina ATCC 23134 TaxID=313606 RepID=A1ZQP8_MICM2|nr:hypothetical protein M23134_06513 [Microscilla marina ATCC 23134]
MLSKQGFLKRQVKYLCEVSVFGKFFDELFVRIWQTKPISLPGMSTGL